MSIPVNLPDDQASSSYVYLNAARVVMRAVDAHFSTFREQTRLDVMLTRLSGLVHQQATMPSAGDAVDGPLATGQP
jgi:hypothetical protein